ncbi:MAG: helix-turn-helix domain-containing protein [bacterium]
MHVLDEETFMEVTEALSAAGAFALVAKLKRIERTAEESLSSGETAKLLGLSSINTVKNWLEGGAFPGAYKTAGGHWRFPRSEVEAVATRMKELTRRNQAFDLAPPDCDDPVDPPLL